MSSRELAAQEAERREHNRLELERIRRQREEREKLAAKKLEEKERAIMERERENLGDWEEKERIFHLSQAYQKVYIRVRENRARNLHLIALGTLRLPLLIGKEAFKDEEVIFLSDPEISSLFNRIEYDQINDALDELNDLFLPFEKDQKVLEFWDAFKSAASQRKQNIRENRNIAIVKEEVNAIFSDKSVQKLKELREGIEKKLKSPNVDTDYWTGLLTELDQVIVKRKLDELYTDLRERLRNDSNSRGFKILEFSFSEFKNGEAKFVVDEQLKVEETPILRVSDSREIDNEIEPSGTANDGNLHINWDNCPSALNLLEQEQTRHVGKDELPFNTEAEDLLQKQGNSLPHWHSKYPNIRPRKPRFFNRVRMNYVWNKYNQTHYDTSNPPPKVVQGFRFNIFYPDLIQGASSSSSVPTYRREADPTNPDNEIVRFSAGAPYADVLFRIPKEEWDMSSQHGFKCIFERGALRLHFWFRSQRYRR